MTIFLICICILVALILILWFSTIYIEVKCQRDRKNERVDIFISLWFRWLRLHFSIPEIDWQGFDKGVEVEVDSKKKKDDVIVDRDKIEEWKEMAENFQNQLHHAKRFLRRVHCLRFDWKTVFGTGDAYETGILTGVIWMIKYNLLAAIHLFIELDEDPKLEVIPVFAQPILEISFHSIVSFRLGHAIIAAKSLLLQNRTRRNAKWPNIPFKA